jgi:hypothetical protein
VNATSEPAGAVCEKFKALILDIPSGPQPQAAIGGKVIARRKRKVDV